MKTALLSVVLLVSLFRTSAFAERTNHYTQVTVYFATEYLLDNYDQSDFMKNHVYSEAWIKGIMERTDTTMHLHQYGFGPFSVVDDPARDSIYAENDHVSATIILSQRAWQSMKQSLENPDHPLAQKVQSVKELTGAEVVRVVFIGSSEYYAVHTESNVPLWVISNTADKSNHFGLHNKMIFDSSSANFRGYFGDYPEGHPYYGYQYATLFQFQPTFMVYPRLGKYQDKYGYWFTIGDETENVLDPDHGWNLDYIYNHGWLKIGDYQDISDTLTLKKGVGRHLEIYPGWNNEDSGDILSIDDEVLLDREPFFTEMPHCRFTQFDGDDDDQVGSYVVDIPSVPDAFAMNSVLVRFVPELEYPSVLESTIPWDVDTNEEFTIRLQGDIDSMTSWQPHWFISGVEYEVVDSTKSSITLKALSSGTMTVTFHHNSLLITGLDDQVFEITVSSVSVHDDFTKKVLDVFPNPTSDYLQLTISSEIENRVSVNILNIYGHQMFSTSFMKMDISERINVYDYPTGVYFVHISIGNQHFIEKFIKN